MATPKTSKAKFKTPGKTPGEHYKEAAQRIIDALKSGVAPWVKPWDAEQAKAFTRPLSAATDKPYKGINALLLLSRGYADPRWCTFNQAKKNGWNVKKGEKSTVIYFFKPHQVTTDEIDPDTKEKKIRTIPVLRAYPVFNVEQMDNVPAHNAAPKSFEPIEQAEAILQGSGATIHHNGSDAFYRCADDTITLPPQGAFKSIELYYGTALHELGHWTGHPDRLDRPLVAFNDDPEQYAREELRAEIASMMLSADLGIAHDPARHAAYIAHWIQLLEDDPKEIFRAARDAEAISAHLLGIITPGNEAEITENQTEKEESIEIVEDEIFTGSSEKTSGFSEDELEKLLDFDNLFNEGNLASKPSSSFSLG